jgi:uncharacterized protein (TIGR02284 family)
MADVIDTLNDLISSCGDSEEGFGKAAKGCHDDTLRQRLIGIARQRGDFSDELDAEVRRLGAKPATEPHQSGIQQKGWRELETRIRPKDDASFLAECHMGEENTLRHFETALTRDLPAPTRAIVERQRLAVQEALLELRSLEMFRKAG